MAGFDEKLCEPITVACCTGWRHSPVCAVVDAHHVLRVGCESHGHVLPVRVVGAQVVGRNDAENLQHQDNIMALQ